MGPCQGHACLTSFPHGVEAVGPRGLCVCRHIPEVQVLLLSVACACIDRDLQYPDHLPEHPDTVVLPILFKEEREFQTNALIKN